jgi:hypothetical protein
VVRRKSRFYRGCFLRIGALFLLIVGYLVVGAGCIWLLVVAFQENVWWGFGCLFLPFVSLVFVVPYWSDAKRPFFVQLAACGLILLGPILQP